jgi:hypothetical protein
VYEILHNGTNGSDASNSRYGRQTVKMGGRICNYFIFPLYFKQWTSFTLTKDYCSHLTIQTQLDMAAGRTTVHINVNTTKAPDRKTSARKHLRGSIRRKNTCKRDVFISPHTVVGLRTLRCWLTDQSLHSVVWIGRLDSVRG